ARKHSGHPLTEHAVDRLPMANVGQVDMARDNVLEPRPRLAEQKLDVVHDLAGLADRIPDRNRFTALQVLGDLPAEIDGAARHDALAGIVGQPLLGIALGGVEWADPAMPADEDRLRRVAIAAHASASVPDRSGSSSPADLAICATAGPKS